MDDEVAQAIKELKLTPFQKMRMKLMSEEEKTAYILELAMKKVKEKKKG